MGQQLTQLTHRQIHSVATFEAQARVTGCTVRRLPQQVESAKPGEQTKLQKEK